MESKHTPGPWRNHFGSIYSANDKEIAFCKRPRTKAPVREQAANANLISAAPDLLEACEYALGEVYNAAKDTGKSFHSIRQLRKAIAKAKGEE